MLTSCTFASVRYALSGRAAFLLYPRMAQLFGLNSLHWWPHVWDAEFVWYPGHPLASSIGGISSRLATIGSKETTNCSADGGFDDRFCHH